MQQNAGEKNPSKTSQYNQGNKAIFSQLFRQLRFEPATSFRMPVRKRAFKIILQGMHAQDAGGPYRDCINNACKELQSHVLPLFIKCPNGNIIIIYNNLVVYMYVYVYMYMYICITYLILCMYVLLID